MGNKIIEKLEKLEAALSIAVQNAEYWSIVCEEIAAALGGNSALLNPVNPHFRGVWSACSTKLIPALGEYIRDGWHLKDYRQNVESVLLERGYATDDDLFSNREDRDNVPFYRDFLFPHNVGFFIGMKITTLNGIWCCSAYFDNDNPPISDAQIALTVEIRALVESYIVKADQIAHENISTFAKFFKGTRSEIHIFDPQRDTCLKVNDAGKISNEQNSPAFLTQPLSSKLYDELREICASDASLSLSNSYALKDNSRKTILLAIQVPPALRHFHMPFKVCLIATDCGDETLQKQTDLKDHFNLTKSEITTLELLANGNSVNSIAELLSLKSSSIRQRLKTIYEKTSTKGQVEAVSFYNDL